ncbi:E3 ubiquitin-protein ligase RNF126-like [Pan paniscus]|uniref:E3 ubiquitin-protein ligase RNF126-like n=1 Tax=Pan paniscus TaxID=9597 RepID=UPI003005C396
MVDEKGTSHMAAAPHNYPGATTLVKPPRLDVLGLSLSGALPPHKVNQDVIMNSLANIVKRTSRDGLDAFAQLLNQFENTGPPPADEEKIQSLPTVPVTEEHVGSGLECPVCKDDYALGEQLPRNHLFHDGCIVHRLEQHDSCPVCRKSLPGHNTATNTPAPGPTGMNCSSSSSSPSSSSPSKENATSNS